MKMKNFHFVFISRKRKSTIKNCVFSTHSVFACVCAMCLQEWCTGTDRCERQTCHTTLPSNNPLEEKLDVLLFTLVQSVFFDMLFDIQLEKEMMNFWSNTDGCYNDSAYKKYMKNIKMCCQRRRTIGNRCFDQIGDGKKSSPSSYVQ